MQLYKNNPSTETTTFLFTKAVNKEFGAFPSALCRKFLLLSQSPSIRMDEFPLMLKRSLVSIKKQITGLHVIRKQLVTFTHQLQSNTSKCSQFVFHIYLTHFISLNPLKPWWLMGAETPWSHCRLMTMTLLHFKYIAIYSLGR